MVNWNWRYALVLTGLFLTLGYSWVACTDGQNVGGGSGEVSGDFEVVAPPQLVSDAYWQEVTGQLRNATDDFMSYAQVVCQIYDGNLQVAEALDNTTGIKAGGIWQYQAMLFEDLPIGGYSIECQASGW